MNTATGEVHLPGYLWRRLEEQIERDLFGMSDGS